MNSELTNEGIRVRSVSTCLVCGNSGHTLYSGAHDRLFDAPGSWDILTCSDCGMAWLNPQPAPDELSKLYATYYTHAPAGETGRWLGGLRRTMRHAILASSFGYSGLASSRRHQIAGWVLSRIPVVRDTVGASVRWLDASAKGRLLDVGCGSGHFLAIMRDLGWEVTGIDPDSAAIEVARRQFGLDVRQGSLGDVELPPGTFDAVTMNHVIEHVPDPIETLRSCGRLLSNRGRLIVITPNSESLGRRWFKNAWMHWDPPRHLFVFSPRTIRHCAERAGLAVQQLRTPAQGVRPAWSVSRIIKRQGKLQGGSVIKVSLSVRIEELVALVTEDILGRFWPVGEEVVLVAHRGRA